MLKLGILLAPNGGSTMTQDTGTSASSYSSVVQRIDSLLDYDLQSETRKELVAHREAAIVGSLPSSSKYLHQGNRTDR